VDEMRGATVAATSERRSRAVACLEPYVPWSTHPCQAGRLPQIRSRSHRGVAVQAVSSAGGRSWRTAMGPQLQV